MIAVILEPSSRQENTFHLPSIPHKQGTCRFCDEMRKDLDKEIASAIEANTEGTSDVDKTKIRLRDLGPGPSLGTVTREQLGKRELDADDLKRNKIPVIYKTATTAGIQDPKVREVIERYLKDLPEMVKTCTGLLIVGKQGVGKSAIAAMVAMEALRNRFSVYVTTHTQLQELRFEDKPQVDADGQSPGHRIHTADLLVLDDFSDSFATDKVFGPAKLETLISERNRWMRTTIMTARISADFFKKEPVLKSLHGVMQETMVGVVLTGDDLRLRRNQEMKSRLGIVK